MLILDSHVDHLIHPRAPADPADFDAAQERFSAVNTPLYAPRAENLFKTAVEYTKVSALLEFPTYPITNLKLVVFALTMTPGPLGKLLDKATPLVPDQRESPCLPGPELEAILKDVTTVYKITRAEDENVPKAETTEWLKWWDELTADWKGALKRCAATRFCYAPAAQLTRDRPTADERKVDLLKRLASVPSSRLLPVRSLRASN